jgi:hypothetical protein
MQWRSERRWKATYTHSDGRVAWPFLQGKLTGISHSMIDSWKSRSFECEGEKWIIVRHVRAESETSVNGSASPANQTGLYFHNHGAVRLLAFTHGALPSSAQIRAMNNEALCALLRRATPFR